MNSALRIPLALALTSPLAAAQCFDWSPGLTPAGVSGGTVEAMLQYDDGSGAALYVGGTFTGAGEFLTKGIARWTGTAWQSFGAGIDHPTSTGDAVRALAVFDDGSGPQLYAAGLFTVIDGVAVANIARWNGTSWSALGTGTNGEVHDLEVWDDGTGPALYACGLFTHAGSVDAYHVARWDGTSWSEVGSGIPTGTAVYALAAWDDGTGSALYAGGRFTVPLTTNSLNISKWNGNAWLPLQLGVSGDVRALEVHDFGSGSMLYLGGWFGYANGMPIYLMSRVGAWNGTTWVRLGSSSLNGVSGTVDSLLSFDDGTGPALYVGGSFASASGVLAQSLAKWNSTDWVNVGGPTDISNGTTTLPTVSSLATFDDPNLGQRRMFVGGNFVFAGSTAVQNVARRDPSGWSQLGTTNAPNGSVETACTFDDGSGAGLVLYVGGSFTSVGALPAGRIAQWDGANWSTLGTGIGAADTVNTLAVFDDGNGPRLYAGGEFKRIDGALSERFASWDGSSWRTFPSAFSAGGGANNPCSINDMEIFDDGSGPALFVCGNFKYANNLTANNIAKWDGIVFSTLGIGLDEEANSLAVWDDGTGPALYVGGAFDMAGSGYAYRVAKWDGTQWSSLGGGLWNGTVTAITPFDDGTGPGLFVTGSFVYQSYTRLARWDGQSWSHLGAGLNNTGFALTTYDDGSGLALYVGGDFTSVSGVAANRVARWRGQPYFDFAPLDAGFSGTVKTLVPIEDGSRVGPALYAGGLFKSSGTEPSFYFARWGADCACPPTNYCTAGTTSNGCNAQITATGTASASAGSGFDIVATGVEGQKLGLIFYGIAGPTGAPWGNGTSFVCVRTPNQRTGNSFSGGSAGSCDGVLSVDLNAWLAAHPSALGQPFEFTRTLWAQAWFRDPPAPKFSSFSDAIEFAMCP